MSKMIFVNLPVKDLAASMKFFEALGWKNNPQFTDETAACMVVSEQIFVMLLTHAKFKEFSPNPIADASKTTEVLNCFACESKDELNATIDLALKAGAKEFREPMDYGFMYSRCFQDLDSHIWEYVWMDPAAMQG